MGKAAREDDGKILVLLPHAPDSVTRKSGRTRRGADWEGLECKVRQGMTRQQPMTAPISRLVKAPPPLRSCASLLSLRAPMDLLILATAAHRFVSRAAVVRYEPRLELTSC